MTDTGGEQLALPGQSAAAYIEKKWGGPTRTITTRFSSFAANTPTRLLLNNPRRMAWTIENNTTFNCYFGFDGTVDGVHGIFVPPLGGTLSFIIDEDGESTTYEGWVSMTGTGDCWVIEVMRK
jgi:hypothetical protein